jgi:hypothetical protein
MDCSHVLLVQDDVLFCRDIDETLCRIVAARPNDAICLFGRPGAGTLRRAHDAGLHWMAQRRCYTGLATILPRERVLEMLRWVSDLSWATDTESMLGTLHRWGRSSDTRVAEFVYRAMRRPFYVPVPCPVDHAPMVSLLGHHEGQSWRSPVFAGESAYLAQEPWDNLAGLCECGRDDDGKEASCPCGRLDEQPL